jgi:hypothetical protein
MADVTPAWREVYTRIADELVGRYTTFWAASDWLSQIGHDPGQDRYPPEWLAYIPEHLRGRYDAPGWCANGVEPWVLQPDPIGSDGFVSFRGFLNLLLCVYAYVSGDDKWVRPFAVTGYQDRLFEWDHHRIVEFLHDQWEEQPAGVHCENTKIWPYCVSGSGLGLELYDAVYGKATHHVFGQWVDLIGSPHQDELAGQPASRPRRPPVPDRYRLPRRGGTARGPVRGEAYRFDAHQEALRARRARRLVLLSVRASVRVSSGRRSTGADRLPVRRRDGTRSGCGRRWRSRTPRPNR